MEELELIEWVNTKTVDNYQDITQLRDGIACCLLTEIIFNDVDISQIIINSTNVADYKKNFELAFSHLEPNGVYCDYNLDLLTKGDKSELISLFNVIASVETDHSELSSNQTVDNEIRFDELYSKLCGNIQSRLCELNDIVDEVHNTIYERDLYLDTLINIEKVSKTLLESIELTDTNREVLKEILNVLYEPSSMLETK